MELTLTLLLFVLSFHQASSVATPKYDALFCFGDSYSDNGNINILAQGLVPFNRFENLPYGITYFGRATGRASMAVFLLISLRKQFQGASRKIKTQGLGLPLLPPYLLKNQDFTKGANFAVSYATALDLSFFLKNNIMVPPFNISLNVQIEWFQDLKPSLCNTTESCNDYLRKALFILGEIRGNDYNYMLLSNKTVDFVRSYVPTVVDTINTAAETLLKQGVMHLMLPGLGPEGCIPNILTLFASSNSSDYDSLDCLKKYNGISSYHSQLISQTVTQLRAKFPQARIIYADYYGPAIAALQSPELFGFTNGRSHKACCGAGGPYNYNPSVVCGQPGATACENPSSYINWDEVHLTEAAYNAIANVWLRGPYANPPILSPL